MVSSGRHYQLEGTVYGPDCDDDDDADDANDAGDGHDADAGVQIKPRTTWILIRLTAKCPRHVYAAVVDAGKRMLHQPPVLCINAQRHHHCAVPLRSLIDLGTIPPRTGLGPRSLPLEPSLTYHLR